MRIINRIFGGFFLACALLLSPSFAVSSVSLLESIEMYPALEGDTLEIRFDTPFTFVTYTLAEPDRLILDPVDPVVRAGWGPGQGVDASPACGGSGLGRGGLSQL
jgi:hypothetical protein